MSSITTDIEPLVKAFADKRASVEESVTALNDEIEALKSRRLKQITKHVEAAANARLQLAAAIESNRGLFKKPRTVVMYGITLGLKKSKGKLDWEDDDQVVVLIEKKLPELADTLIKTTKKPVKGALAQLPAADLKKIGVTVEEVGDMVVIATASTDVDKLIKKLFDDAEEQS